jgi:hypothetical protein
MGMVASGYQYYYDNLSYRSAQFQGKAMAGEDGFDFLDYEDYGSGQKLWALKNTMDVLDEKELKDLVYLHKPEWKSTVYQEWVQRPVCE